MDLLKVLMKTTFIFQVNRINNNINDRILLTKKVNNFVNKILIIQEYPFSDLLIQQASKIFKDISIANLKKVFRLGRDRDQSEIFNYHKLKKNLLYLINKNIF